MITKLYLFAENIWFKLDQKIRFVLVGGFNTVLSYCVFASLYEFGNLNYNLALTIQNIITINISFITMRYYVFQSHGILWQEYCKTVSVYIGMYFLNAFVLNLLVLILQLPPLIAQAIYLTLSTIITYLLHKYFSFKKKK